MVWILGFQGYNTNQPSTLKVRTINVENRVLWFEFWVSWFQTNNLQTLKVENQKC